MASSPLALKKNTSLLADWPSTKRIVPTATSLPPQPTGIPAATPRRRLRPSPTTTAAAVTADPQAAKPAA